MREYSVGFALSALCLSAGVLGSGCITARQSPDAAANANAGTASHGTATNRGANETPTAATGGPTEGPETTQVSELKALILNQNARLDAMETRLGSLGDKTSRTQLEIENMMANRKAMAAPTNAHPSEGAGTEPQGEMAADDPEAGFISDRAIQDYRKGIILLEAQKYSEAVLAFSSFVEKYPDHALAGSAQYNLGEAYFKQKEYKLALHEFERVLTSYDRSPHISETLRDMAEAEDALKLADSAARHRQLLTSLFAQSPAASGASAATRSEEAHAASGAPAATHAPASPPLDEPPATAPKLPTAPLSENPAAEAHEPR